MGLQESDTTEQLKTHTQRINDYCYSGWWWQSPSGGVSDSKCTWVIWFLKQPCETGLRPSCRWRNKVQRNQTFSKSHSQWIWGMKPGVLFPNPTLSPQALVLLIPISAWYLLFLLCPYHGAAWTLEEMWQSHGWGFLVMTSVLGDGVCSFSKEGEEMATHSNILAWRSPWTEKPGGLQSMGWQSVRHDLAMKQA